MTRVCHRFLFIIYFLIPVFHRAFLQTAYRAAFLTQSVQLDDYIVKFEIWDTAGQCFP